jgi:hypothetical protein
MIPFYNGQEIINFDCKWHLQIRLSFCFTIYNQNLLHNLKSDLNPKLIIKIYSLTSLQDFGTKFRIRFYITTYNQVLLKILKLTLHHNLESNFHSQLRIKFCFNYFLWQEILTLPNFNFNFCISLLVNII